jgi:hypothetical protein
MDGWIDGWISVKITSLSLHDIHAQLLLPSTAATCPPPAHVDDDTQQGEEKEEEEEEEEEGEPPSLQQLHLQQQHEREGALSRASSLCSASSSWVELRESGAEALRLQVETEVGRCIYILYYIYIIIYIMLYI